MTRTSARSRTVLTELYDAAVAGAAPGPVTAAALRDFQAKPDQRIWLYALGKAGHAMAAAATATLQRNLLKVAGGVIVSPELAPSPYVTVTAMQGDHPLPGRHSFNAAERIGQTAAGMRSTDIAIVLLSGGVTSLIAAPLRGMSESDLGQLFELLLTSGLDIRRMNAVRKRFARWGAGRMALALAPARTHAFIMSDVLGDDPSDIGSGPCSPDAWTAKEVTEILQKANLFTRISPAMRDYLAGVGRGVVPETPKRTHPAFAHVSTRVIGSNSLALDAVKAYAAQHDLDAECAKAPLEGDASACGTLVAEALLQRAQRGAPGCMIWGGETTVKLQAAPAALGGRGAAVAHEPPPSGGRCQELALAAARRLAQAGDGAARITLLAAGTDGRDGTADAAGAFADGSLWESIRAGGRDPELALQRHESHGVLGAAGALLPSRHTGTNVMDVVIGLVE